MNTARTYKILLLLSVSIVLAACEFEPDIAPLEIEEAPEAPAFGQLEDELEEERFPGEALIKRLDEMFDPYYMGKDTPYEETVYEEMDQIIAGAYDYHGHDLADIAARAEPNPLTENEVLDYLAATGQETVVDPETGEEYGVYDWYVKRVTTGNTGPYLTVLNQIDANLVGDRMNFERTYLAALFEAHPDHFLVARLNFRQKLLSDYGEDAEAMYEFIESLEPSSD